MSADPETPTSDREQSTRRALWLARFTVAYNVVEGGVAVAVGLTAGLVSMVGFGVDSAIESIVAVLVALRLSARLRHGAADEARERLVLRLVGATFYVLAAYVVVEGIRALVGDEAPSSSPIALALLVASLIVMPLLARAKTRVARELGGDPLVLADAAETKICVWLSASTLMGIGLFQLTGATWLDPLAGFVIAGFAVHEGREAWEGSLVDDED